MNIIILMTVLFNNKYIKNKLKKLGMLLKIL